MSLPDLLALLVRFLPLLLRVVVMLLMGAVAIGVAYTIGAGLLRFVRYLFAPAPPRPETAADAPAAPLTAAARVIPPAARAETTATPPPALMAEPPMGETVGTPPAAMDTAPAGDPDEPPNSPRRIFLQAVALGLGGLGTLIVGIPFIGVLISPVRREDPDVWRPVGAVNDFPVGATVQVTFRDAEQLPWAGFSAQTSAWLRRETEQDFIVFSAYCTHVGCPVRWQEDASLFMCPCHGGAYYRDGTVAAGPPPRPLDLYAVQVRNGQVEVATRRIPLPQSRMRRNQASTEARGACRSCRQAHTGEERNA